MAVVVRVVVAAVVSVGATFVAAWVVDRFPAAGGALSVLSGVMLALTVLGVLRQRSWRAAVSGIGTMALVLVAITGISAVFGRGVAPGPLAVGPQPADAATVPATDAATPVPTDAASPTPSPAATEATGDATVSIVDGQVVIALAAPPDDGDRLAVWTVGATGPPEVLAFEDGAWAGPVTGTEPRRPIVPLAPGGTAVAVTTSAGERIPPVGHLTEDGTVATASGSLARQIEDAVATVQASWLGLSAPAAGYAAALLSSQLGTGTTTSVLESDGATPVEVRLTVRYPELAQHVTGGGSLHVLADRAVTCDDGACAPTSEPLRLPVFAALAIVTDDGVSVTATDPDGDLTCVVVAAPPDAGPTPGRHCWDAAGNLRLVVRDDGPSTRVVDLTDELDPSLLTPPEA